MKKIDRIEYFLAFRYISNSMEREKVELSKHAKTFVEDAKNLLSETLEGLRSKLPPSKGYHFVEDSKEIVEALGWRWKNASSEDVKYMISKFIRGIDNLETWFEDPKSFYEDKKKIRRVEELSSLCKKMRDLYEDNPKVVTD